MASQHPKKSEKPRQSCDLRGFQGLFLRKCDFFRLILKNMILKKLLNGFKGQVDMNQYFPDAGDSRTSVNREVSQTGHVPQFSTQTVA